MTLHWSSSAGRNLGIGKCCCKVLTGLLVTWMSCSFQVEDSCERFRNAFDVGKDCKVKLRDPLLLGEKIT